MDRKIIKEAKEIHTFNIKHTANKNKTDLDILYEVLQKNNKIKISTIAKAFKVKEETAMEWCKILESAELAIIDYPALRKPILILLTKKKKINPLTNKKGTKEGAKPLAKEKKKLTWKEKNLKKGLRKGQSPLQKKKAKQDKKLARKKEKQNKENEKKQTKVSKKKAKQDKKSKRKQSKINKKKTKQNEKKLAKESKKKAKQEKKKKPTKKRRKRK
jgi:hypothetical protein